MGRVRTAISIDAELLARIDVAAREFEISRSRLLADAANALLTRRDSVRLLRRLNGADADEQSAEEMAVATARRKAHRRLVER